MLIKRLIGKRRTKRKVGTANFLPACRNERLIISKWNINKLFSENKMAPTKNVSDLSKKVARKRATKAKPVKKDLKTSTIKLQITTMGEPKTSKPPKIERKVTSQRKIELANEVAYEQLTKSTGSSLKVLPSLITKAPIKAESEATTIKPKSKRKTKPTPKLAALALSSDAISLVKIATKHKEKAKDKRKSKTKDTEVLNKILEKKKHPNVLGEIKMDPNLSVIIKKPGPKSKTMPPVEQKIPEISAQETIDLKIKTKKCMFGKMRTVQNSDDIFDGSANKWEDIINPLPVKKCQKRKKSSVKLETDTMKDSEEPTAKKSRGKLRTEFFSQRLNGNKLKVTRIQSKSMHKKAVKGAAGMQGQCPGAAPVQTRSNSVHSAKSNLSWTIDISTTTGTETCYTVSSDDFVRYDKKLPIVQVDHPNRPLKEDIKEKLLENDSSSSGSVSKTSDSSSDTDLDLLANKPDLNLSTSSLTTKSPRSEDMSNTELFNLKLAEILNNTKTFLKDLNKWIVLDDDDTATFSTLLEADKIEKDVITDCENFGIFFKDGDIFVPKNLNLKNCSPENNYRSTKDDEIIVNYKEVVNNKDSSESSRLDLEADPRDSDGSRVKNREKFPVNIPDIATAEKTYSVDSNSSSETFTSDNYNYLSFDDKVCDDEDALSIFAESITGIESSRMSTVSNMSVQDPRSLEVYVPKPTRPCIQERYTYQPTQIGITWPSKISIANSNADSSLIHSKTNLVTKAKILLGDANRMSSQAIGAVIPEVEQAYEPYSGSDVPEFEQANKPLCDSADIEAEQANMLRRRFPLSKVMNPAKSSFYRGHCFFYLSTQCKNTMGCRYSHKDININVAVRRLAVLTDDNLIQEYFLTARSKNLRRKFGLLFVQECKRREATRILMQIAIDLGLGVVEWEDNALKVGVLETTLLHLNTISCGSCVDLLMFEYKGTMMCDALLLCMANSQNFAQFKRAFEKLAKFMAQIQRPVDIYIVGNILERVCILPAEDSLARGMLCLMQNTSPRIFNNRMANSFETQLSNIDSNVLESYLIAKKAALPALLSLPTHPSLPALPALLSLPTHPSLPALPALLSLPTHPSLPALPALMAQPLLPALPAQDAAAAREGSRHSSPGNTDFDNLNNVDTMATTNFNHTMNSESIRHLFKSPSTPAPKLRFSVPPPALRAPSWRAGAHPALGRSPRPHVHALSDNCMYRYLLKSCGVYLPA